MNIYMGFAFQIRPVTMEKGFVLSCEGILREERPYRRLVDAVVDAITLGRELDAEVQIFDLEGKVAETFHLRRHGTPETTALRPSAGRFVSETELTALPGAR